jgi:hypothetical protein
MKFYQKIVLTALALTLVTAGASALSGDTGAPVADPGWWAALGEGLIGVGENGWCSCL